MNTSAVIPFCFQSNEVRALTINGEPWFIARDVCDVLEYADANDATKNLDEDEKLVRQIAGAGQSRNMLLISESGLYTLIIRSNKPQAKPFRKWVTAEVLPSIRKTGGYVLPGATGKRADIFHHRGPVSDSGLDIRYTLDLTKVVLNPKLPTLEVLERLTGIQLTDLADRTPTPSAPFAHKAEMFAALDEFSAAHLRAVDGGEVLFKDLYRNFLLWYGHQGFDINYVPSLKAVSSWCDRHGYPRRKPCGRATVYGVVLVEEVVA